MKKFNADIDIDVSDRKSLLQHVPHIIGLTEKGNKHTTGVYFQMIEFDQDTNVSKVKPSEASELGYFKMDFLNLSIYDQISSNEQLCDLLEQPTDWSLLNDEETVSRLLHVSKYYDLLQKFKIESIKDMAIFLSIIRPAKKHLIGKDRKYIEKHIWEEPVHREGHDQYYYKKSHAFSYAMVIKLQLNLITYQDKYASVLDLLGDNTK